ncbi:MAG: twin-arginine translocase subunit TatC [Desulfomonilia bacterium]|uniref:Sec-independent protein translocase protein TatC n=1 Tax=anaerobic digester metagenome TaxID=1263854 RepID=A0A485LYD8_9ZZZZ|nr:twin-arginine translocase subunit TatC [Pseudomonadota bacterium]HPD21224.1 twin-arginine translocase subunit TatC [Deltaproteobacteria bacterium]HPX18265.1 twin-arginine translocase subunit TatC [Deltaproteobacteria bacterium]HRS55782.1 twin-arginine translocase subunit TatC [Desulfomonilia bacterium]HRV34454.1 twin-arginine translocase subunit TatC [Desulfomonilia bacterium]
MEKDSRAEELSTVEEEKLPIHEHLEELRWRLIKCIIAVAVGFVATYAFKERIFEFLVWPLAKVLPENSRMIYTSLPEAFITYLKVAFFAGLILATPVIFYQIWKFVMPGLYPNERRYVIPFMLVATLFFLAGVSFAYFVVFPYGFMFFLGFQTESIAAMPTMKEYLGLVMKLMLAFGVCFELPVIMFFLAKMGLVSPQRLTKSRKYAILIVFVMAAILTPPDVISQIMLAIPLLILYEISIWVTRVVEKKSGE